MTRLTDELTCREMVDFIADYLDGSLAPHRRDIFDAHLRQCPDCVAYLGSYAATVQLAKGCEPDAPVPPDVPEDLVRAILAARPPRPS